MNVAVVGGGLAGLSAAWRLRSHHDVVVYEAADRAGGALRSERLDQFVFDWGPNAFSGNAPELAQLVRESGLHDRTLAVAAAPKRFLYWGGRLHAVPLKPPQALATRLITPLGKLSALRDLFARAAAPDADESVDAFFARHFGPQVAERIVAPALLGITGGDSKRTSARALFPRLLDLEGANGSLVRAAMRARRPPGILTSFAGGMQDLSDALARGLGTRLRTNAAVDGMTRDQAGWRLHVRAGEEARFDAVVLALPAYAASTLVVSIDPELARLLDAIEYAPMRVVGIAFERGDVPVSLNGFGFLAARGQGVRILGALYTSSLFPVQSPAGAAYLRVFLGGAVDSEAATCDANEAEEIVRDDLRRVLGIAAPPIARHEKAWPRAIPQYGIGHVRRVRAIEERAAAAGGLTLIGNAYRGVGITDVVRDAFEIAERLAAS